MISSWPARTRDFTVRLFASARSARETPNLRATVSSVSPLLRRVPLERREVRRATASASRALERSARPDRHLDLVLGILHRRRPAAQLRIQRLDLVDRRAGPFGDAAEVDGARDSATLS